MNRASRLLLLSLPGLALLGHCLTFPWIFEDSFISYRYAENLALGQGLVYNPGELVEGYTSFLWVLVLALARLVVTDLQQVGPLLSLLCGLGLVVVTGLLARRCLPEGAPTWLAVGAALLAAAHGTVALYAVSGMETACFGLLLNVGLLLALGPRSGSQTADCSDMGGRAGSPRPVSNRDNRSPHPTRRAALLGAVLVLAVMCRPEAIPLAALLLLICWRRQGRRVAVPALSLFGLGFVLYLAWRLQRYGFLFPNTYYAKVAGRPGSDMLIGLGYVEDFLWLHLGVLGLVGVLLAAWRRAAWAAGAALFLLMGYASAVAVGGDIFPLHRFLVHLVPLTCVGAVWLLWSVMSRDGAGARKRLAVVVLALAGLVALGSFIPPLALLGRPSSASEARKRIDLAARVTRNYERIAAWMKQALPPHLTVAINAAGVIPFRTRMPTVDMLGLTDAHIAHRPVKRLANGALGHEKHDAAYVLRRRPDLVFVGLPFVTRRPPSLPRLRQIWTNTMLPGDRELIRSRQFSRQFALVVVQVDQWGHTAFYMRRSRMHLLERRR